jgi:hypothetical protein
VLVSYPRLDEVPSFNSLSIQLRVEPGIQVFGAVWSGMEFSRQWTAAVGPARRAALLAVVEGCCVVDPFTNGGD